MVFTTVGGEDQARVLIEGLVEDRIVACGTMVGATSIFRWGGAVTSEAEVLVILKTRRERWPGLEVAIKQRHPYDVPELLALPVVQGIEPYLDWVDRETSDRGTRMP